MEIKQTDSLLTFYPDTNNNVEIFCPECDVKRKLDPSNYQNNHKVIDVKCQCGKQFKFSVEFRKLYRAQVSLAGSYVRLKNQKQGDMLVENLSMVGLGFDIHRNLPDHKTYLPDVHIDKPMIGNSEPMRKIKAYILKVAATDSTILITGETGTGKELVVELIHRSSPRAKKPFICINCAALPENLIESEMFGYERGAFTGAVTSSRGKFEQAEGGTVFLDEIADMSPYAQAKVLRAIEMKEVNRLGGNKVIPLDVRMTAATNRDPEQLVEEGNFREDLYYRLNVARLHLPALRDRKEDIPHLVNHAIRELNQRFEREVEGVTDEAMEILLHYHWPGNVRELINLLEATFINLPSRMISFMDFPNIFRKKLRFSEKSFNNERDMVLAALSSTNWNKSEAAKKLKWSRMKVYRTLKRHMINLNKQEP